jgi:hypothetical protein
MIFFSLSSDEIGHSEFARIRALLCQILFLTNLPVNTYMTQNCHSEENLSSPVDNLSCIKKLKEDSPAETAVLRVKKLSKNARLPERGSSLAAGYDLFR